VTNSNGSTSFELPQAVVVGSANGSSASYSICEGESITVGGQAFDTPGTFNQVYTNVAGCDSIVSISININPLPQVSFLAPNETLYCDLDLPVVLVGDPAGGVFTGPGMSGNIFNPAIAGVGAHTITYTYTDPNVCSGEATLALQVEICEGVGERGLTDVIIYPNPSNGLFTVSGLEKGQWLRIYDSAGKLVHEQLIGSTFEQVIASNLATGNYVLRSVKDGEEGALRFVILHP
jgi:hypothetical protein